MECRADHQARRRRVISRAVVRPVPRLRGVLHLYAVGPALAFGVVLVAIAPAGRSRVAAIIYGTGLCACLGVSALYHRGRWTSRVKAALARLDHATIFLLVAGTASPIFILRVRGELGMSLLTIEWIGAACGIAIALLWKRPPIWAEVGPYLLLGWIGIIAIPALVLSAGWTALILLLAGGALYTIGATCYAVERPNPWPSTFGFHEIFHSCVTAAAAVHAVMISFVIVTA